VGKKQTKYQRLAKLAKDNDNVATRRQLSKLGFGDKQISLMLRRGHWVQLQRGVYLLAR
jgi:hypothetical protein